MTTRTWPQDDEQPFIIHDDARRNVLHDIAGGWTDAPQNGSKARAARALLQEHYTAIAAMVELKALLDAWTAGRKP